MNIEKHDVGEEGTRPSAEGANSHLLPGRSNTISQLMFQTYGAVEVRDCSLVT